MIYFHVILHGFFNFQCILNFNIVVSTHVDREKNQSFFPNLKRLVLRLFHQFCNNLTTFELFTCCFVKVRSELCESCQFTILSQSQTNTAAELLNNLGLSCTTYTGHRNTRVNSRTDTCVEQVGFQEDLAVSNGNYVGRNESCNVTGLGFNNRKSCHRTSLAFYCTLSLSFDVFRIDTSSSFEKTAVQVENVARISFTSWWSAQKQRDLTICPSLLGQVIINNQGILTAVSEVFTHCCAGVRSNVLHSCRFGCRGGNDDGVIHCAVFFQFTYYVGDSRSLLTDSNINTDKVFTLLVDDGIDSNGCLTCLTVANDQFTLAASDWNHGIN